MESKRRSIVKALSWRFLATIITTMIVWLLTGKAEFAATVGVLDTSVKILLYFIHERIWLRISFGKKRSTEYEI